MTVTDGRAEHLAQWVREMPLQSQVLITGTTLVLEGIARRRQDLPYPLDFVGLRESEEPAIAVALARSISSRYEGLAPVIGADGVDENWRISNMTRVVAEAIEHFYPSAAS